MDTLSRVQILDEVVCISHNASALGNTTTPNYSQTATGK